MSTLPFNQIPTDPTLKDLLDVAKKDTFLSLSCHHVGTIQEFDSVKQTASITINYKKTYYQLNSATGLYDPLLVDYPVMVDCPVICLGGGAASLTFPIAKGDECLVLFNDRAIDNWFQGGAGAAIESTRLHSFADGIALVGLRSLGNVLENYDSSRAVLQNGSTMVAVGPSLVKIANDMTTLKEVVNGLIDIIKGLTTIPVSATVVGVANPGGLAVSGLASQGPLSINPTGTAQLDSYKTTVGGLLE